MTTQALTGLLLLVMPVAYNLLYTLLARGFAYPDILRQPTSQVLERFTAGGSRLVLLWWGFAMSAVLLAPAVVLLSATLDGADPTVLALATAIGLLAALVQFLGLIRWPFAEFVGPFEAPGWKLAGARLEAGRHPGPIRLHRLVHLAAGPGRRPAAHRLTLSTALHRSS